MKEELNYAELSHLQGYLLDQIHREYSTKYFVNEDIENSIYNLKIQNINIYLKMERIKNN